MIKILPYIIFPLLLFRIPYGPKGVDFSLFGNPDGWFCEQKRFGMILSFMFVCLLILGVAVWQKNKALALFFGVAVCSAYYPVFKVPFRFDLICIIFGMIWYLFWAGSSREAFLNIVCIACLVHTGLVISQSLGYDPVFNLTEPSLNYIPDGDPPKILNDAYKNVGFFTSMNFASYFIAVCFPAFLRKWWVCFLPVVIAGLIITQTTGSIVALFIACTFGLMVADWDSLGKAVTVIMLFLCLMGYSFIDRPDYSRWEDWKIFARIGYNDNGKVALGEGLKPEGIGLGNFYDMKLILHNNIRFTHVHNEFLEGLIEMGWGFVPVCFLFLWQVFKRFRYDILAGMGVLIGIIISSVSYPMHIATIAAVVLGWLSIMDSQNRKGVKT